LLTTNMLRGQGKWVSSSPSKISSQILHFLYVKSEFLTHNKGAEIKCLNPSTGQLLGTERAATKAEVEDCIAKAQIAQKKWAQTSFDERRLVLQDMMDAVLVNAEDVTNCSSLETGKTPFEAKVGEIMITLEKLRHTIRKGEEYLKPEARDVPLMMALGGKKAWLEYHPIGVIGAIVPWNYPFHNWVSPVISALFAGNACIVKASEGACWSRSYYEKLIQDVLIARGHDPNLAQLVPGYGETGATLVSNPGVGKILFIGSPGTGKRIMKTASDILKPVILELGGKDPFIVMDPCNVELAVDRAINASFFNMGQNCIAGERILVDQKLFPQFSSTLVTRMKEAYPTPKENTVCYGAMTMRMQLEKVEVLLKDAVSKGAKILYGGQSVNNSGNYFEPTVITNLNPSMTIWTEEVFGPVMLLIPFSGSEEAIKIANATPFGLAASVHCSDIKKAEKVAHQIESGMAVVNDYGLSYLMQDLPFGGCKESGFGCFNGPEGIRGFCRPQAVVSERWSPAPAAAYPRFLKRPLLEISQPLVDEVMILFYGFGLQVKAAALVNIVKLFLLGKKSN